MRVSDRGDDDTGSPAGDCAGELSDPADRREEYVEAVLSVVEQIPPGRVSTYGEVADVVGAELGRGGPRLVGQVMARHGAAVAWWRVVRAGGRPAAGHESIALDRLREEGVRFTGPGRNRVDLGRHRWTGPSGSSVG